jgi:endo-1,4-beta-xylanase
VRTSNRRIARTYAVRAGLLLVLAAAALALAGCGGGGAEIRVPSGASPPPAGTYSRPLGMALQESAAREDEAYLGAFVDTATSLTPENELKWAIVQPEPDRYDFGPADALVDLARRTGKRVRGHTLVWEQQLPAWVSGRTWTAPALRAALLDHIKTVVEHFRGKVASWDVVNEPFDDDGGFTPNLFFRVLGPSYIETALRAAREADPDAKLFVNELAAERPGPKRDAVLTLAGDLHRRGVPLDGIGLQDHTTVAGAPSQPELEDTMNRAASLGLDVELTEVDVAIPPASPTSPRVLDDQTRAFGAAARACAAVARCTGMTVWGVDDRWSWLGPERRPLLFDAQARPKPALGAVRAGLGRG